MSKNTGDSSAPSEQSVLHTHLARVSPGLSAPMSGRVENTGIGPGSETAALLKAVSRVSGTALHPEVSILHFSPGPGPRILKSPNQAYARRNTEDLVFLF